MTTQMLVQATDQPVSSPFAGTGKLRRVTFLPHILNPWSMTLALLLPIFIYAMFGMTDAAHTAQTGCRNLVAAMIVMMTTCGTILIGDSFGATLSAERTTDISHIYALTLTQS